MAPLVTPLPDGWQKRLNVLVLLLAVIASLSFILSALYFERHPLLLTFIPNQASFWEGRFNVERLRWLLLFNGVTMLALIGLLMAVQQPALGEAWHRLQQRVAAHSRRRYYGVVAAMAVGYTALRFGMNQEFEPVSLDLLTDGEALAPFQYRVLVPWVVKAFSELGLPRLPLYVLVEAASAGLLLLVFERFLRFFFPAVGASRLLSFTIVGPLLFTFASPQRTNDFYFPWDTPSIALLTLGLVLLYQRRWLPYYLLFVIATFNRETTCFLTMIYFITALLGQEKYRAILFHCGVQFVIWAAIKQGMILLYPDVVLFAGEGRLFEDQVIRNIDFLANPLSYFYMLKVMGGIWLPVLLLAAWVPAAFVRRGLLVVVPFFVGMFIVGLLGEIRIYGELIPLVLVAFLLILRRIAHTARHEAAAAELVAA